MSVSSSQVGTRTTANFDARGASVKTSGICSVCRSTRLLHLKDGTVHLHGPRRSPCPGSHKPPLVSLPLADGGLGASVPTASPRADPGIAPDGNDSVPSDGNGTLWAPHQGPIIKHIPKAARSGCAAHLAALFRSAVDDQSSLEPWIGILNWSHNILSAPTRRGKRHNLTAILRGRLSDTTTDPDVSLVRPTTDRTHTSAEESLSHAVVSNTEQTRGRKSLSSHSHPC